MIIALVILSIPFLVLHYAHLKRALHVFQFEGYKRRRFLDWCRHGLAAALFLAPAAHRSPW